MNHPTLYSKRWLCTTWFTSCLRPLEGVLLGILGGGVLPGSPNPDLISDQKMSFPRPFSDKIPKIHTHFRTWPNLACSGISDNWGDSPVFSCFIFMFSLFQFSRPNYLGAWNRLGLIRQKLCHHYQKKYYPNAFRIRILISISLLFIWNCNDEHVHSCTLP